MWLSKLEGDFIVCTRVWLVLPRPVLKVGLGSLYVNLLFLDPALWVAEMIFYRSYI
jgi:hypothetical protein